MSQHTRTEVTFRNWQRHERLIVALQRELKTAKRAIRTLLKLAGVTQKEMRR